MSDFGFVAEHGTAKMIESCFMATIPTATSLQAQNSLTVDKTKGGLFLINESDTHVVALRLFEIMLSAGFVNSSGTGVVAFGLTQYNAIPESLKSSANISASTYGVNVRYPATAETYAGRRTSGLRLLPKSNTDNITLDLTGISSRTLPNQVICASGLSMITSGNRPRLIFGDTNLQTAQGATYNVSLPPIIIEPQTMLAIRPLITGTITLTDMTGYIAADWTELKHNV